MVVSLEMVLPGLAGYLVDRWIGTLVLFTMLGFAAGTTAAVMHLIRMTRADERKRSPLQVTEGMTVGGQHPADAEIGNAQREIEIKRQMLELVQQILRKVGVTDRTQAAVWAVRMNLF
jgi:hypothetical protein